VGVGGGGGRERERQRGKAPERKAPIRCLAVNAGCSRRVWAEFRAERVQGIRGLDTRLLDRALVAATTRTGAGRLERRASVLLVSGPGPWRLAVGASGLEGSGASGDNCNCRSRSPQPPITTRTRRHPHPHPHPHRPGGYGCAALCARALALC
jgi:hypothetical protein